MIVFENFAVIVVVIAENEVVEIVQAVVYPKEMILVIVMVIVIAIVEVCELEVGIVVLVETAADPKEMTLASVVVVDEIAEVVEVYVFVYQLILN